MINFITERWIANRAKAEAYFASASPIRYTTKTFIQEVIKLGIETPLNPSLNNTCFDTEIDVLTIGTTAGTRLYFFHEAVYAPLSTEIYYVKQPFDNAKDEPIEALYRTVDIGQPKYTQAQVNELMQIADDIIDNIYKFEYQEEL